MSLAIARVNSCVEPTEKRPANLASLTGK